MAEMPAGSVSVLESVFRGPVTRGSACLDLQERPQNWMILKVTDVFNQIQTGHARRGANEEAVCASCY